MELSVDKRIITMSCNEASHLRGLAVKEFNRKIKRKVPKGVRPAEWAAEAAGDRMAIVEIGECLDKAYGTPAPAESVE